MHIHIWNAKLCNNITASADRIFDLWTRTNWTLKGDKSDLFCPLLVTVTEEGSEQTAVGVVNDGDQEMLVEFKCIWEL